MNITLPYPLPPTSHPQPRPQGAFPFWCGRGPSHTRREKRPGDEVAPPPPPTPYPLPLPHPNPHPAIKNIPKWVPWYMPTFASICLWHSNSNLNGVPFTGENEFEPRPQTRSPPPPSIIFKRDYPNSLPGDVSLCISS